MRETLHKKHFIIRLTFITFQYMHKYTCSSQNLMYLPFPLIEYKYFPGISSWGKTDPFLCIQDKHKLFFQFHFHPYKIFLLNVSILHKRHGNIYLSKRSPVNNYTFNIYYMVFTLSTIDLYAFFFIIFFEYVVSSYTPIDKSSKQPRLLAKLIVNQLKFGLKPF